MEYYSNDLPSSTEKTLLWGQSYTDSGYSSKAESISYIDTAKDINDDICGENNKLKSIELNTDSSIQYNDIVKAIPELLKLLNDEDYVVVSQAATLVNEMAKNDQTCIILINNNCMVNLFDCLANCNQIEIIKNVVSTIYNISKFSAGVNWILKNPPGLQMIVNMLSFPIENIISYSITILHNVLLSHNDVKTELKKLGVIQKMINLLKTPKNAKLLAIVVDCLQQLCHRDQESKMLVLQCDGPVLLIEILKCNQYPKLTFQIIRLLKVLSVCPHNKTSLVNNGAMQVLSLHLKSMSSNELQNCLLTLRNLSDAATKITDLDLLIENLMHLISTTTDMPCVLAAGILSNLTCNNEKNKLTVLKLNGMKIIIDLIEKSLEKYDLIEPCIRLLHHLIKRHEFASMAQEEFQKCNGISLLSNLLSTKVNDFSIIKATFSILRVFAADIANTQIVIDLKLIEKTMQMISYIIYHITLNQAKNLFEIVDIATNISILFMKNYNNAMYMKHVKCIDFFVQLLNNEEEKIQNIGITLLTEIAKYNECIAAIDAQAYIYYYLNQRISKNNGVIEENIKQLYNCIQQFKTTQLMHNDRQYSNSLNF